MLEFDGQALDPAIVSAQPMKPGQTIDLQQMGCPASELHSVSHYSDKIPAHLLGVVNLSSHLVMHLNVLANFFSSKRASQIPDFLRRVQCQDRNPHR